MMTLEMLNQLNAPRVIQSVLSLSFNPFGKVLTQFDTQKLIEVAQAQAEIPMTGNSYVPSCSELERLPVVSHIQQQVYGGLPIQAGICAGRNSHLTGLEYHQGSEVVIAGTDCIHLIGRLQDINEDSYDNGNIRAFFQPKGTAIELYSTTLHYAPCKVTEKGYVTIVILLEGTNTPLKTESRGANRLLTKTNKFLIVHSSQEEKIASGVHAGLLGPLVEIKSL